MIVHIPYDVMKSAIKYMQEDLTTEQIGFFGMVPNIEGDAFSVDWYPADNVSPTPADSAEIEATWIAELILNSAVHPIAMMHSHPSGQYVPSDHPGGDYDQFPSMYVDVAFIWVAQYPDQVTQYTATQELHVIDIDEVLVHVQ